MKPTRQQILSHKRFLRRQKVYENKYYRQFLSYLESVNRDAASQYRKTGSVTVNPQSAQRLERIYSNLYKQVTIAEAEIQWHDFDDPRPTQQKDIIDSLIGAFANSDSIPIRLWRSLLGEFITTRIAGRIAEVEATTRKRIAVLIQRGIEEGLGAEEVAKTIQEDTGYNRNRSRAIARTETITSANQGKYMAALSSPYVKLKKWLPTFDDRTRPSHLDMLDRPFVEMDQLFFVANADGVLEEARFPCDVGLSASNTVNCYLPDTIIKGNIKSAQRSFYSGECFEIITVGGKKLSVTPNHGILTDQGFVPAKNLKVGYNLLCDGEKQNGVLRLVDNYVQKKFRAANIFRAFSTLFTSQKLVATTLDFDGDGVAMDGNIDIIDAKRSLYMCRVTSLYKKITNFLLQKPLFERIGISGLRPSNFFGSAYKSTFRRLVSFLILSFPFSFRHIFPLNFFCLGLVSKLDVIRFKDSIDNVSRDVIFLRELINTSSVKISFDNIASIRKFNFSGHVYDFSSVNGVNIANNIYTSNCRCVVIFQNKLDPNGLPIRKTLDMKTKKRNLTFTTEIHAIDPKDGKLKEWSGDRITAINWKSAQDWADNNGKGYLKINGEFIEEIEL